MNIWITSDLHFGHDNIIEYCNRPCTKENHTNFILKQADDRFFSNWDKAYQTVIKEHEQGADFTIPQSNRVEHKHFAVDDNVAHDHLAKIKAMLAGVGA